MSVNESLLGATNIVHQWQSHLKLITWKVVTSIIPKFGNGRWWWRWLRQDQDGIPKWANFIGSSLKSRQFKFKKRIKKVVNDRKTNFYPEAHARDTHSIVEILLIYIQLRPKENKDKFLKPSCGGAAHVSEYVTLWSRRRVPNCTVAAPPPPSPAPPAGTRRSTPAALRGRRRATRPPPSSTSQRRCCCRLCRRPCCGAWSTTWIPIRKTTWTRTCWLGTRRPDRRPLGCSLRRNSTRSLLRLQ